MGSLPRMSVVLRMLAWIRALAGGALVKPDGRRELAQAPSSFAARLRVGVPAQRGDAVRLDAFGGALWTGSRAAAPRGPGEDGGVARVEAGQTARLLAGGGGAGVDGRRQRERRR